jgi:hypothetical protein
MKTIIQNNNPALVLVTAWTSQKDGKAIIRVQSESILAYEIVEMACKGTTEITVNPITIHGTSRAYEALTVILDRSTQAWTTLGGTSGGTRLESIRDYFSDVLRIDDTSVQKTQEIIANLVKHANEG